MTDSPERTLQTYLERMAEIRSTGSSVNETSFYSALENLLNQVGGDLSPRVICNGQLRNQGAGHPDFGLYSQKQCLKGAPKPGLGEIPERGVVEVKPLSDDTWQTSQSKQATKYFDHYRLVMVTNYRDFRLIGEDTSGKPVEREFYSLASDEADFWTLAAHSKKAAKEKAVHFVEFLKRVLMNAAPLTRPEDVAWFLASYARDALVILEAKDASALAPLRNALELALGIKFDKDKGEHFFRSTLVQTLFYGVFSAWAIWAQNGELGKFDWRHSAFVLTVPMIRSLFEELAKPSRLTPLGLVDMLDRTGEAINRIDVSAFFKTFHTEQAVQHFYEPFLEAFDPELRKQMGVWYTPHEVVKYIVSRVDKVLRDELGLADGLANKNVYVLDPCCGTGTFLIEVLRKIEETLKTKGADALIGDDIKDAAQHRIFGFEIMSAPFVIAHWQVGNLLNSLGAPFQPSSGERPAIYLTNALTGWTPPQEPKTSLPLFPELEQERDQAEHVKRDVPILVVLGNPPYNAYAGTSPEEEQGLVEPYKEGLVSYWGIKKFNLDELYVRFFRIAERRISATGQGVFCYISNASYVSDPSFVVARSRLLKEFDSIWIDSMNGDSRETGKLTPDGQPDPSVFSTPQNRAGIRVGTAIGLFVRRTKRSDAPAVLHRDFWGIKKREELLSSLDVALFDKQYQNVAPEIFNKLSLKPTDISADYRAWPLLPELGEISPINGLMEKRAGALIDIDSDRLETRMRSYLDTKIDWAAFKLLGGALAKNAARFEAEKARANILKAETYNPKAIRRYVVRPFDVRHCYYTSTRPIWNEPRPQLWEQYIPGNQFLMCRPAGVTSPEGVPVFFTKELGDNDAIRGHAYYIPFTYFIAGKGMLSVESRPNMSKRIREYLLEIGCSHSDIVGQFADAVWLHSLAICHAPKYVINNAGGLAISWPRIPLPSTKALLIESAGLGRQIADLLSGENPSLSSSVVAKHLQVLGLITATDLAVTAGWGHKDTQGKVFPGKGKVVSRNWTAAELAKLKSGLAENHIDEDRGLALLGKPLDVYLNETTCWTGVPETVWEYLIGGYQVVKKWLSYREWEILGRSLSKEEAREVTSMVRRLSSIVILSDVLDKNYQDVCGSIYSWPTTAQENLSFVTADS